MVNEVSRFARACVQTRNTRLAPQQWKIFSAVPARGGQLEFGNLKPGEFALDHRAQRRVVRLRAGSRIVQRVTEILVGGGQMDQNKADTIDGKIEPHFALAAHRGARDGVERILTELAELRVRERIRAYLAEPAVELAQRHLIAVRRHEIDALQRQ